MTIVQSPIWFAKQFFDVNGNTLAGGQLFTYLRGSNTIQQTTWSDNGITLGVASPNTNPITLDESGILRPGLWIDDTLNYTFIVIDSNGNTIQSIDYPPIPPVTFDMSAGDNFNEYYGFNNETTGGQIFDAGPIGSCDGVVDGLVVSALNYLISGYYTVALEGAIGSEVWTLTFTDSQSAVTVLDSSVFDSNGHYNSGPGPAGHFWQFLVPLAYIPFTPNSSYTITVT